MHMQQHLPSGPDGLLRYDMGAGVTAFSPLREAALPFPVLQAHQVHSDHVAVVTSPAVTRDDLQGTDAIVTSIPGLAVAARTADCIPVLLYDPVGRAVAAVHAGWKGTVIKIVQKTLRVMKEHAGTAAGNVRAVIGPGIGPDSFQVGPEVADAFRAAGFPMDALLHDEGARVPGTMQGGLHIDLWAANAWLLRTAGVPDEQILVSGIDTYQRNDLFFSARREGASCGRIINVIRLD